MPPAWVPSGPALAGRPTPSRDHTTLDEPLHGLTNDFRTLNHATSNKLPCAGGPFDVDRKDARLPVADHGFCGVGLRPQSQPLGATHSTVSAAPGATSCGKQLAATFASAAFLRVVFLRHLAYTRFVHEVKKESQEILHLVRARCAKVKRHKGIVTANYFLRAKGSRRPCFPE